MACRFQIWTDLLGSSHQKVTEPTVSAWLVKQVEKWRHVMESPLSSKLQPEPSSSDCSIELGLIGTDSLSLTWSGPGHLVITWKVPGMKDRPSQHINPSETVYLRNIDREYW